MMLSESDDYLPISALQHLVFCERQVALIHVLGRWEENVHTAVGRIVHERVDAAEMTTRPGVRILRGVGLRSARLRLRGVADVVEVHTHGDENIFVPIEYKKGGKRRGGADDVQLAAQAMALEEMTGTRVVEGAVFMARVKRRRVVAIDARLRAHVEETAARLHAIVAAREVPRARLDGRCVDCSLRDECGPEIDIPLGVFEARLRESLR